jgi:hypothetical protein
VVVDVAVAGGVSTVTSGAVTVSVEAGASVATAVDAVLLESPQAAIPSAATASSAAVRVRAATGYTTLTRSTTNTSVSLAAIGPMAREP